VLSNQNDQTNKQTATNQTSTIPLEKQPQPQNGNRIGRSRRRPTHHRVAHFERLGLFASKHVAETPACNIRQRVGFKQANKQTEDTRKNELTPTSTP
jgi:hypothetical protein